jgi:hypothetical protein
MNRISSKSTKQKNVSFENGKTDLVGREIRTARGELTNLLSDSKMSTCKGTSENDVSSRPDLGDYYIGRMQEAMEQWYSKPRDGQHVTDVVMCPRQKVYREIDRIPIDEKTVSIYSAGKAIHEAIQRLFLSDKRTFEQEKYIEFEDIQGSVDIYDRKRNIPLEFKTTRASEIKEPKIFHVEQLRYYMSLLDAEEGYMIYQLLMHFDRTPFRSFRIIMNEEQRKEQREKLLRETSSLKKAMEVRDPALARAVDKDSSLNWLCRDCPYLMKCQEIQRAAAGAT